LGWAFGVPRVATLLVVVPVVPVSWAPTWFGVLRADISRPPIPAMLPASAAGTMTPEAGAETCTPSLLNTLRFVANALSVCALLPENGMYRWLAGIGPMVKPCALSQLTTEATGRRWERTVIGRRPRSGACRIWHWRGRRRRARVPLRRLDPASSVLLSSIGTEWTGLVRWPLPAWSR